MASRNKSLTFYRKIWQRAFLSEYSLITKDEYLERKYVRITPSSSNLFPISSDFPQTINNQSNSPKFLIPQGQSLKVAGPSVPETKEILEELPPKSLDSSKQFNLLPNHKDQSEDNSENSSDDDSDSTLVYDLRNSL